MKCDDFSEFFGEHRDFFSTLKNWQEELYTQPVTYLFLTKPFVNKGANETEFRTRSPTDIVYIGQTGKLGERLRQYQECVIRKRTDESDMRRIERMKEFRKDGCETRISLLCCSKKEIAEELEDLLLNAFNKIHGICPITNLTSKAKKEGSVDSVLERMRDYRTKGDIWRHKNRSKK